MQYFGGKAKISKHIAEFINTHTHTHTISNYVEPFCGSCNVAIKINCENKILNDRHPYLIAMWKSLQEGWIPPNTISEDEYKLIKENMDVFPDLSGFAGFGCSFSGKWFDGYARCQNGNNYCGQALRGVQSKISKLKNTKFYNLDYLDFTDHIPNNSLIYCDPPYKGTSQYKLVGKFDYDIFVEWLKIMSETNIILVSEYKHNLPEGAKIVFEIESSTSIRDKTGNVIKTTEILYTFNNL